MDHRITGATFRWTVGFWCPSVSDCIEEVCRAWLWLGWVWLPWLNTQILRGSNEMRAGSLFLKELVLAAKDWGGHCVLIRDQAPPSSCSTSPVHGLLQFQGDLMTQILISVCVLEISHSCSGEQRRGRRTATPFPFAFMKQPFWKLSLAPPTHISSCTSLMGAQRAMPSCRQTGKPCPFRWT